MSVENGIRKFPPNNLDGQGALTNCLEPWMEKMYFIRN
jgi:hypothetical protein